MSDCKEGLTCIEGLCDEDITSIAGEVPVYSDSGASGAATGAAGAALTR